MKHIDARKLQVGQRIFARVALDMPNGWAVTGYAMRVDLSGSPAMALGNGMVVDLDNPSLTIDVDAPTSGHHAPWRSDPLPELLPQEVGSLILARVPVGTPRLLELIDIQDWDISEKTKWEIVGGNAYVDSVDIGDDWVQLDSKTLRPMGTS